MPPELPNDEVLSLKKRARRRLVGAIAMVLLMIIALPMVLQDRASLAPQDAIKITMPETHENVIDANVDGHASAAPLEGVKAPELPTAIADGANEQAPVPDEVPASVSTKSEIHKNNIENKNLVAKVDKKTEVKENVTKPAETKPAEVAVLEQQPVVVAKETSVEPTVQVKPQENKASFAIQVGVYSDATNVKQIQAKLKAAGYTSHTEKVATAKGEKIRLRAGNFTSRQEAADALVKLQGAGLSGIVISNE